MSLYLVSFANTVPILSQHTLSFFNMIGGFDLCMFGITVFVFHRSIHRGFAGELSRVLGLLISMAAGLYFLRVFDELVQPLSVWIHNLLPAKFVLILLIVVVCFLFWVVIENICAVFLNPSLSNRMDIFLGGLLGLFKAVCLIFIVCCVCYMQPDENRVETLGESSWVFSNAQPFIKNIMKR